MDKLSGKFYVVATPIGNLEDITFRALKTLKEADLILAEDTRTARKLLSHFEIRGKRVISCYHHNELQRINQVISELMQGRVIAYISEAGTPGISDPGGRMTRILRNEGASITPIPGPSALTTALSVSGAPANAFVFEGLLPSKPGKRKKRIKALENEARTVVLYESPHRLIKCLNDILELLGDREILVCKELTKLYEDYFSGRVSECIKKLEQATIKGEYVIIIYPLGK